MNVHRPMPHRYRLLPLLLIAGACGENQPSHDAVVATDSAGIEIVESSAPAWRAGEEWRLAAEPSLTIGMAEGAEEYLFTNVSSAVRRADGGVAVADARAAVISLYDADGRHVRTTGGRGGGPGEFQFLSSMTLLPGDTMAAYDLSNGRVSLFDPAGAFVRAVTITPPETGGSARVSGILSDGSALGSVPAAGSTFADGLQRRSEIFVRYGRDGALLDTIAAQPGSDSYSQTSSQGGGIVGMSVWMPHFGRRQVAGTAGEYVVLGSNDSYELQLYRPDGTLARLIRRRVEVRPVTDDLVAASVDMLLAGSPNEQARQQRARSLESVPHLPTVPFYQRVLGDAAGNLWVEEFPVPGEAAPGWAVFDSAGRLLGNVQMPEDFRPMHIGADFVLGAARDEFDVERVLLYPLEKGP